MTKKPVANRLQLEIALTPMKNFIFCLALSASTFVAHGKAQAGSKHSHKAHVHGSGHLSLAFDGLNGKLEFESPAGSTVGFEHLPKTDQQKNQVKETLELLKNKMPEMVVFKSELGCVFKSTDAQVKMSKEANHSETYASFDLVCNKSPKGSEMMFQFTKIFPKLKKVEAQILIDDIQKSLNVTKSPTPLVLE